MLTLATILEEGARRYPDKIAVVFGDKRFSFAQLNGAANQVANGLEKTGIRAGDKVALSCPNVPYFPIIYYGILKAGAVVVPLNVLLKRREIAYHLEDSDAKAYFCFQGTAELPIGEEGVEAFRTVNSCEHFWVMTADPAAASPFAGVPTLSQLMAGQPNQFVMVQTSANDTAVILYTSGTTGHPKGAELTHSNMLMNAFVVRDLFQGTPDDIQLVALPLFHSFGQTCQMNSGLLAGNTLVLMPRFDPDTVFASFEKENVTLFCGVPTMYWALLHHPGASQYDLNKIANTFRVGVSGGAAMPLEVLRQFEKKFKIPILEGYGLSETSPVASFNHLDRERKAGSIGQPIWGVQMKVVDENGKEVSAGEPGEVVIRGHNVMKGYYNKPEESAKAIKDDWFYTGDAGKMDEDGYFYIVDRLKDMILRGGYNVYPREVEEVLLTHPDISLAAVLGVPHGKFGEEIKAFLVLKQGATVTEEEIIEWSKTQMADYKYPRMIEIRDSLPMTSTGKILKRELRNQ